MTPPPPPPSPPPPPGGYPPEPPGGYGSASGAGSPWGTLAEWSPRALGWLVDTGIGLGGFIVVLIVAVILGQIAAALGVLVYLVGALASLGWSIWLAVQVGQTGASPGMRLIGLKCLGTNSGQPIGAGMGVVRALAHIVDGLICYIGWLFPLWDAQRQTLADKIIGTVVIVAPKQPFSLAPPEGTAAY